MGKITDLEQARRDGMSYAYKIVAEKGIAGLEQELRFRGYTKAPIGVDMKYVDKFVDNVKKAMLSSVLVMSVMVLRDEFGFGRKRLGRFIERFNFKSDCIYEDYASWMDFVDTIKEETGLDLRLNMSDEKISITSRVYAGIGK